jgi:hypothetical protein
MHRHRRIGPHGRSTEPTCLETDGETISVRQEVEAYAGIRAASRTAARKRTPLVTAEDA